MKKRLEHILYVEDEPDIRAVTRIALEQLGGFRIETCASGEEALEVAAQFMPDLILLDVMMPGMDGPTTLKRLREQPVLREIPVIFMTAKVQIQEVAQYKALGALNVIAKPFDPMALAATVQGMWDAK